MRSDLARIGNGVMEALLGHAWARSLFHEP